MDGNDLLSAALDECGIDFEDMQEQANETPRLQILQNFALPTNIKSPFQAVISNLPNGTQVKLEPSANKIKTEFVNQAYNLAVPKLPNQFVTASKLYPPQIQQRLQFNPNSLLQNPMLHNQLTLEQLLQNQINKNQMNDNQMRIQETLMNLKEEEPEQEVDEEENEFATADTFMDYMPSKLKIGIRHPDPVVETSSLSNVLPPDVWYRLNIPEEVIDEGKLSALQLEAVVYACQQHEHFLSDGSRAGFLIGDGAGVGKGRTIAGIIYENFLQGRKRSVWLSVSSDLKYDSERDLFDIGASKIEVHPLNKFKYGCKIHSPENDNVKRGIIFATYSSLISESTTNTGKYGSRFKQLVQWCGEDFEGVIVFDECHKAKNLFPSSGSGKPTKTGLAVLELQNKLPKARIVYASATGATEPKNMGYMTRLGIWGKGTPFEDFTQFVSAVEKRGVGAMELVAIDLKMRGMYMARQLSFSGVNFTIEEVPLQKDFIKLYNKCAQLWVEAKLKFEKALELMGCDNVTKKTVWTQFWASHQRFFKYLCIASKVKFAVKLAKESLRDDKCIVIGLQSTGEARTLEQLEENGGELNDFVSTAKAVFQSLIEKHFPAANRKKLMKILGRDTSFFDDLGITLKRNSRDEIVAVTEPGQSSSNNSKQSKGTRRARIGAMNKLAKEKKKSNYSDSDDSDDSSNDNESDFEPSDEEEESESDFSEDFSESDDDNDNSEDDISDDEKPKKGKKRKSNFSRIFLNANSKKAKREAKLKEKKKKPSIRNEIVDLKVDAMSAEAGEMCSKMRDELLEKLEKLSDKLPANTLDELIDELGGPDCVAEMTGRKGRVVSTDNGSILYESRSENDVNLEMLNLVEKQRFMDDEKRIAIISEAASSGISLHSDKRAKNKHRRVHITVELPWSADRAIQQFGRTHRSNQTNAPEYVFLISDLAGEKRFASIVAKRLESLGALTHGDRRATESRDLSRFNIDNKYGRMALEIVMKSIVGIEVPMVKPPENYEGDFFNDCLEGLFGVGMVQCSDKKFPDTKPIYTLEKDYNHITKFLNRLLGLEVEIQNSLFKYFSDTMDAVIRQAKRTGRYDSGIIDLSSEFGKVKIISSESFILKSSSGAIKIQLHTVSIDRGMSWEEAQNMWSQCKSAVEGFYFVKQNNMKRNNVFLAVADTTNRNQVKHIFRIYKPNSGLQSKYETLSSLKEKGKKVLPDEVKDLWEDIFNTCKDRCAHQLWYGNCKRSVCDIGFRNRIYCILSGAILTVWPELEKKVYYLQNHRLQIVRLKTDDGLRVIGPMVPPNYVEIVKKTLKEMESAKPNGS